MAEARQRDEWSRTASVMALVANTQRNPKKTRPFRPSDFDPFARAGERRQAVIPAPVSVLKDVFIRENREQGGSRED
ncbi:MAG: hypothetical protein R3B68_04395 [Phycisphaerales bacterium]